MIRNSGIYLELFLILCAQGYLYQGVMMKRLPMALIFLIESCYYIIVSNNCFSININNCLSNLSDNLFKKLFGIRSLNLLGMGCFSRYEFCLLRVVAVRIRLVAFVADKVNFAQLLFLKWV